MLPIQQTGPYVDQQRMRRECKRMSDGTRGTGDPNPNQGRKATVLIKYVTKFRHQSTPTAAHSTASTEPEEASIGPASFRSHWDP